MDKSYSYILFILGLYFPLNLYCQDINQSEIYSWFDAEIGIANTGLYNGIAYNEFYRVDNDKNKFLFSTGFQPGAIIYDGQPYYKILMNFNIHDDVVLVELENEVGTNVFQLLSEKIESFNFSDRKFIRVTRNPAKNISSGFYEVLLENLVFKEEGNIKLLKKHKLSEKVKLDKKISVYSYKEKDSEFVVQTSDGFFSVWRKKDFETVFPNHKDEISRYYRNYRSLRKSNPDKFMIGLTTLAILQNR